MYICNESFTFDNHHLFNLFLFYYFMPTYISSHQLLNKLNCNNFNSINWELFMFKMFVQNVSVVIFVDHEFVRLIVVHQLV